MLKAARQFEPLDAGTARATYLAALSTAVFAGRLAAGGGAREVAEAARWAPASPQPAGGPGLLMDGLALLITEGYVAGTPVLKQAVQALRSEPVSDVEAMPWAWLAYHAALIVWDCESWRLLVGRQVSAARDAGALVVLSHALDALSVALTWTGDFAAAAAPIAEREEIVEASAASQFRFHPFGALQLAAWRGDEAKITALIEGSLPMAVSRGAGLALAFIDYATAVLYNGLGRYEQALAAAQQASEHPQELLSTLILPELIEAAARSGQAARAADALALLAETTRAPPARTGRWARRRARAHRWPAMRPRRIFTARRSTAWATPACPLSWPAPTCFTVSGCAASAAGVMPAISCAPHTRSSSRPAPGPSPNARESSCARLASGPPNAPRRRKMP